MFKVLVLIPVADNDGTPFSAELFRDLEDRLLIFGSWNLTGESKGVWIDAGQVYMDRTRRYELALSTWKAFPAWLSVVRWAQRAFKQEAMYIEVAGVPEIIAWGKDEKD